MFHLDSLDIEFHKPPPPKKNRMKVTGGQKIACFSALFNFPYKNIN